MSLCPFSEFSKIFGAPNKGFHKMRLINTAAGDYIGTIIGAIILTYFTQIPLVLTTISLLFLGLVLHILFGVPTAAVKYLGLNCT